MKKLAENDPARYDWSRATRGTIARRLSRATTNLRALDDDLAAAFPDSESVNAALRAVLAVRDATRPRSKRARRAA